MGNTTEVPEVQHLAVQMGMDHNDMYLTALLVANYNQTVAAKLLGMNRSTFQYKLTQNTTKEQRTPKVGVKPPYRECTAFALINPTPPKSKRSKRGKALGLALVVLVLFCMASGFGPVAVNSQPAQVSIEIPVKFEGEHEERICDFDASDFSVLCK